MEETKEKRRQSFTWIAIVLVLWTLLFVLVGNFMTSSKKESISIAEKNLQNDVYTWSEEIDSIMQLGLFAGSMLQDGGLTDANNLELARKIVENTPVEHIYQVHNNSVYMNESGETVADLSMPLEIKTTDKYFFLDDFVLENGEDREDSLLVVLPIKDSDEYIVVQILEKYIWENCFVAANTSVSFLSVADRQGNICITFDNFRDRTSSFFTNLNFLNNVSSYNNSFENASQFKSNYSSGIGSAILSEYKNEKRMIITNPIGDTGFSLVYGIRYENVENLIESYRASSVDTMVKITIVVLIFSAFIVGVIIFTSLRNKETNRSLETKADTDLLTELNNKLATERKIQEYMAENENKRGLMFILDIDNFKKINDTMGHAFGDTLLRTLGKEIRAEFRASDIIGRTGGDEFIIFLKNLNDDATIEREANRLLRFFQDFKAGGDYVKYSATASIGAAIYPDDADNFKELYVAADKALYKAKKRGKNQLCFFNEK